MESFSFVPTMPVQRRLTKIYTDTKNIYDFIKEPVRKEDPELSTLHRKLKIQKDRLVSWGLEWSDGSSQSSDIDDSITKAGLSELVGSVMSTIKEILAEVEPLWQSSKRDQDELDLSGDSKRPQMLWDKSRFEDLIRDLTMSIDTLYGLSKTRQSARQATTSKSDARPSRDIAEEKQFQSSRMSTPQQIDPKTVIFPENLKSISGMSESANASRRVVFMRRPNPSDARKLSTTPTTVSVLLEHASYDPIYSITGITPPMTRFEMLFAGLSQAYISTDRTLSGLLRLIGYYEEAEHSRFCLLFSLPMNFGPVDIETPTLKVPIISTLTDMLHPVYEPSLEIKYRLASNVANAVFDLHSKGAVHGNLVSSNVIFFEAPDSNSPFELSQVNLRQSYLASFDLFSDNAVDNSEPHSEESLLYKHPLDPRITRYTHLTVESKSLDLYSLSMLLLQIGLWISLRDIFPGVRAVPDNPMEVMKQLSSRCGSVFAKAVQACWQAPNDELSQKARPDVMHQKVFWRVSKALDACCAIDEVTDSETSESDEPIPTAPSVSQTSSPFKRLKRDHKEVASRASPQQEATIIDWSEKPVLKPQLPSPEKIVEWTRNTAAATAPAKAKPKLRSYPSIRISQEHLNFWHTGLMPRINQVLRGFYRKYHESVEMSLESIGESSSKTKPTILVICTSANKVRFILKNLVYDKATYGLKVCRGKVVRSRKQDNKRSMADDEIQAVNTAHQDQPTHGASIGAFVKEKHLPPVSFGGTILVDDKPYGMTVHHMLDDPSDSEGEEELSEPVHRSSAAVTSMPHLKQSTSSSSFSSDEQYMYSLSDYDSDTSLYISDSETYSDFDIEDEEGLQPGDKRGVTPEDVTPDDYLITQPALDDVPADFYPSDDTRDEDHLDSFTLGSVHCSSGIRRRSSSTSSEIMHEIDWALFKFLPERLPTIPSSPAAVALAKNHELPGMKVSSLGRTTGFKKGRIQDAMSIVKMAGRCTPSASWTVIGGMGVPGDSGAWVISDSNKPSSSKIAGSILAYSNRKACAYICPMDLAITDIAETMGASKIALPGGGTIYDALAVSEMTPTRALTFQQVETAVEDDSSLANLEERIRNGMRFSSSTLRHDDFDSGFVPEEDEEEEYIPSDLDSDQEDDTSGLIPLPSPSPPSEEEEEAGSTLRGPFAPSMPLPIGTPQDWEDHQARRARGDSAREDEGGRELNISKRSSRPPVFSFRELMDGAGEMGLDLGAGVGVSPPGTRGSASNGMGVGRKWGGSRDGREEVVSRG